MSVLEIRKWELQVPKAPAIACDSLLLSDGEIVTLEGASGSGKSLFLRSLVGLEPVSGDAHMSPAMPWTKRRLRVQLMPQIVAFEEGTVLDVLSEPFSWKTWKTKLTSRTSFVERIERELSMLGFFSPRELMQKRVSMLSGGERSRTALVRSLLAEPSVLLLDEPTSALDPDATRLVENRLMTWVRERPGRAILLASHDELQRRRLGGRGLRISGGRIQEFLRLSTSSVHSALGDFTELPV